MDLSKYEVAAAGTAPSAPASPSIGYPTDGNLGTGVPATVPGAHWYYQIQAELTALLTAGGVTPAIGALNQLLAAVDARAAAAASAVAVPVGTVIFRAVNATPTGFLKCNGALISRTTYAELFAAIGTTFGAGNGTTTFAVPELRGEFVRGLDDGRGVDTSRALGAAQAGGIESHTHRWWAAISASVASTGSALTVLSGSQVAGHVEATGGAETRPRNYAMCALIKY